MPARRYSNGATNLALQLTDARELTAKAAEAARLLTLLANEHRLAILCEVIGGERSVGSLVAAVGMHPIRAVAASREAACRRHRHHSARRANRLLPARKRGGY